MQKGEGERDAVLQRYLMISDDDDVLLPLPSSSLAQLVITGCFDTQRFGLRKLMNQTSEFSLHTAPVMPSPHHHHPHREIYKALKIPDVKRLFSRATVSQHQLDEQMKQSLMTSTKPRLEAGSSLCWQRRDFSVCRQRRSRIWAQMKTLQTSALSCCCS